MTVMYKIVSSTIFVLLLASGLGQVIRLERLKIYPQWMTLSGFSSGGTFAQQLQISYSSLFSGIAVFSHTFYRCGPPTGVQDDYDRVCTTLGNLSDPFLYDTANVLNDIQNYYDEGLIDNPVHIQNKRLYVFAGTRNNLFTTDMSLRIMQVYEPLIQNTEAVKTRVMEATLLLPTNNFGRPCQEAANENLFLGNCGISGAYEALQFLLGDVVKKPQRNQHIPLQPLLEFDQTEFFYGFGDGRHDMDTVGFLYVPSGCSYRTCLFHFYFHGCMTGREFNGTSHIVNSGYLEVAETSNIIMVFPQAVSSVDNDIGCWDTYGFTGLQYATQRGHQVTVVRNILARILGEDQHHQHHQPATSFIDQSTPPYHNQEQHHLQQGLLQSYPLQLTSTSALQSFRPSIPDPMNTFTNSLIPAGPQQPNYYQQEQQIVPNNPSILSSYFPPSRQQALSPQFVNRYPPPPPPQPPRQYHRLVSQTPVTANFFSQRTHPFTTTNLVSSGYSK